MTLTNDLVLIFRLAQLLLSLAGILWFMIGSVNTIDSSYLFYLRILRVYLPSCLLTYTSVIIGILLARFHQEGILLYAITLCAETIIIEKLIVHAIRFRRRFVLYDQIIDSVMQKADEMLSALPVKEDDLQAQPPESEPDSESSMDQATDEQSE